MEGQTLLAISIHSLVKRETFPAAVTLQSTMHFNPLPRKEGDADFESYMWFDHKISIHSLVKRETTTLHIDYWTFVQFQSTPS